jgi:dihydropteroate synthase
MTALHPHLMGVINVTPDSFSDGGRFMAVEAALEQARLLISGGASILDVGGESTRPGAERVPVIEEISRVVPVIHATRGLGAQISIDTMNAETALAAVSAGATIVNDVSGGLADPAMLDAAAATGATFVVGHWRGHSQKMDSLASYENVAEQVAEELAARVEAALKAGVGRERIVVDPGLGFSKDSDQNWSLLANFASLEKLGYPILVGASRKRFIASALEAASPVAPGNDRRDLATAVLSALLLRPSVWGFRVHDVAASRDAIAIANALRVAGE